ncbi:MAG: phenylalanine--tRNA ligase subunit alpha [Candidatus Diapherotrites archaeon]|jgi:phenylalanyl-tRNA synthetase alpha chain|uniref:phenylalanine--tRNA ligase n=1 Tax=Candidatus Iainarchaeum sp. TaxID=3101447 RepID=A0A8T5GFU5_9ARCH|nr:phenylalanine--tRNA ligase subunit alpha [Candidatus Diapherotrites archaeon]
MLEKVKQLSKIEREVLAFLGEEERSILELAKGSSVGIDSVRRAVAWLNEKGLAKVEEKESENLSLTKEGKEALTKGMPENIFLETLTKLGGKASFSDLQKETALSQNAFTAALGINKRKAFIIIAGGEIEETGVAKEQESFDVRNLLQDVVDQKTIEVEKIIDLSKRGLVEKKSSTERTAKITKEGLEAKKLLSEKKIERVFDVSAPVPKILAGKKQPYQQFIKELRQKMVELGYTEMKSTLVTHEFYHFDGLYQPQNHPARTWTDTYQLKQPTHGKIANKKAVAAIKAAHENGGVSDSKGWGYTWDLQTAEKLMPPGHGTGFDIVELCKPCTVPGKYFVITRCFRPDVLDATHLLEFSQLDCFIIGEGINFKHLLGQLELIAREIGGAEKVKFFPDYYPFTEPSVQLSAYNPTVGWMEFAGGGVFRPEMLENLGYKKGTTAIAWGLGIDRLAMMKLGIKDIRNLFSQDLGYLREAKVTK